MQIYGVEKRESYSERKTISWNQLKNNFFSSFSKNFAFAKSLPKSAGVNFYDSNWNWFHSNDSGFQGSWKFQKMKEQYP